MSFKDFMERFNIGYGEAVKHGDSWKGLFASLDKQDKKWNKKKEKEANKAKKKNNK